MLCFMLNKNTSGVSQRKNDTGNIICTQGLGVKIFDKFWDLIITEILLPLTTPTITSKCSFHDRKFYFQLELCIAKVIDVKLGFPSPN